MSPPLWVGNGSFSLTTSLYIQLLRIFQRSLEALICKASAGFARSARFFSGVKIFREPLRLSAEGLPASLADRRHPNPGDGDHGLLLMIISIWCNISIYQSMYGGDCMSNILREALQEYGGMISTKQVLDLGISKTTLTNYVRAGKIERVGTGVYMLPDTIEDDLYSLSLHSKWIIFSHDTALFLNHLAERTPFTHTITIPSNASLPGSMRQICNCHYIKPEFYQLGAMIQRTTFGHEVPCYNPERTICDLIRNRSAFSVELISEAVKAYAGSQEKDLNLLSEYAEKLHILKALKPYLEVLL